MVRPVHILSDPLRKQRPTYPDRIVEMVDGRFEMVPLHLDETKIVEATGEVGPALDEKASQSLGLRILFSLVEFYEALPLVRGDLTATAERAPVERVVLVPLVVRPLAKPETVLDKVTDIGKLMPVFLNEPRRRDWRLRIVHHEFAPEFPKRGPKAVSGTCLPVATRAPRGGFAGVFQ